MSNGRSPIAGDIAKQFNTTTFEDEYAVYDGTFWQKLNTPSITNTAVTATQAMTASSNSVYNNVSAMVTAAHSDICTMFEENIRVAEYIDESGKPKLVQLEWREGPGNEWSPIRRVKIKL